MKRNLLLTVAFLATFTVWAQNIAVVSPSNETTIYQTLDDAVAGATNGSVVYLPGGGFQIKGETKIDKRITLMGVSHRGDTDNVDGATVIAGNLNFVKGSSGSAVIGMYVSGNINLSEDSIDNIVVRHCNINSIQIKNSTCTGTYVNQCYLRNLSRFAGANGKLSNCICSAVVDVNGCDILNNIFLKSVEIDRYRSHALYADNSIITGNIIVATGHHNTYYTGAIPSAYVGGTNNTGSHNMTKGGEWGDNGVDIGGETDWNNVFEKYNQGSISLNSNFHLKGDYKQYDSKIGIYGGTSFTNEALAPIPRIVSKKVAEQTDGTGKLKIEVTVKAQ